MAAFGELLAVSHLVPNVGAAVPLQEFVKLIRLYLINPTRSLRMLALRATQIFCKAPRFLVYFVKLQCDYLLARCMEKSKQAEEERTSAFKVVRTFLEIDASRISKPIIQVLLAHVETRDDPCFNVSVQLLIELAIRNPRSLSKCGGMKNLFSLMVDPPGEELLSVLATTVSYLLDDDTTRQYIFFPHDLKILLAPLTDTYDLVPEGPPQGAPKAGEAPPPPPPAPGGPGKESAFTLKRWANCVRAIVLLVKSWSGVFALAAAGGFDSIVSALNLPSMNLHAVTLDGLLEIFRVPPPKLDSDASSPFPVNHQVVESDRLGEINFYSLFSFF